MSDNKNKVMHDKDVAGGEFRRGVDQWASETLGGYRSVQQGNDPSVYGKYVEPVIHAAEHAARGAMYGSDKEYARARDELRTFGSGLHTMDGKYQSQFK